jgi:hypothetical protein
MLSRCLWPLNDTLALADSAVACRLRRGADARDVDGAFAGHRAVEHEVRRWHQPVTDMDGRDPPPRPKGRRRPGSSWKSRAPGRRMTAPQQLAAALAACRRPSSAAGTPIVPVRAARVEPGTGPLHAQSWPAQPTLRSTPAQLVQIGGERRRDRRLHPIHHSRPPCPLAARREFARLLGSGPKSG